MSYIFNLLIAIDQLLNAVLGRAHDLIVSSRVYLREMQGGSSWHRKTIDKLFFWQLEHCQSN